MRVIIPIVMQKEESVIDISVGSNPATPKHTPHTITLPPSLINLVSKRCYCEYLKSEFKKRDRFEIIIFYAYVSINQASLLRASSIH
jgi:hypothetical protein